MSGGQYNYQHFAISNLAEEMLSDLNDSVTGICNHGINPSDTKIIQGIVRLTKVMDQVAHQARMYDLFISGDIGKSALEESLSLFKGNLENILNKDYENDPNKCAN